MIITVTLNPALDRTLIVPEIIYDEVLRSEPSQLDWGGKGFNVSRALKVLGSESLAMGLIGGHTGAHIEEGLHNLGIETAFTKIKGETRTNTVILDSTSRRHIKVNEPGPIITSEELANFRSQVRSKLKSGDIWVLSGSLPPGVSDDFYTQLITEIQNAGSHAYLDTSGEPLRLGLEAKPYLIKPNRKEAEEITGISLEDFTHLSQVGNFFIKKGVQIAAISLGPEGLFLFWQRGFAWAHTTILEAKNPTGAGDALLAGLLWALQRGETLSEAARWGAACGAAAAQSEGVGIPSIQVVESFFYKGAL